MLKNADVLQAIRSRIPSNRVELMSDMNFIAPNGLALNHRFSRLYVTDSVLSQVSVFDVNPDDGSLSNQKVTNFIGREMGGLVQQILRLKAQEASGLAKELQAL